MISVTDYTDDKSLENSFNLPNKIDTISVSYDNGRVSVSINGETVFEDNSVGSDFNITMNRE